MSGRTDWWPALHFTRAHATTDSEENPELWAVKASLTKILCPGIWIIAWVMKWLTDSHVPGTTDRTGNVIIKRNIN